MLQEIQPQETEVVAKAKRRTFTAKYKREIVRQADACKEPGAIGMLLRREGLYSSHLTVWRREIAERELSALAPKKRGPKAKSIDPREQELAVLRRQVAVSNARAERAELLVEIQKNSRVRPDRPPVRPETPAVGSMPGREEWPPAFWCSANP